jgi:hypothetical protein
MWYDIFQYPNVRFVMSVKNKTIAFAAVAVLAVAGGAYGFMPGDKDGSSASSKAPSLAQTAANQQATDPHVAANNQGSEKVASEAVNSANPKQLVTPNQPVVQATNKLTRQQLTPPPANENEKLQKAAEQESNF